MQVTYALVGKHAEAAGTPEAGTTRSARGAKALVPTPGSGQAPTNFGVLGTTDKWLAGWASLPLVVLLLASDRSAR